MDKTATKNNKKEKLTAKGGATVTIPAAYKEWTIMIYMAGDNNLSEDMVRAILEMRKKIRKKGDRLFPTGVTPKNKVSFTVEFKGEHPFVPIQRYNLTYSTKLTYQTSSRPVNFPRQPVPPITLEERLKSFITDSMRDHPASNYALILSGHSDSFLGRTLMLDEDPSGVMTLQSIEKVLEDITFPNSDKIDILAFDSCVMNTIEVLYQFKDVAHTCVGSQGSIPNFTWDYEAIASELIVKEPADLTKDKVIKVFKKSLKSYNEGFAFDGRSVDFSEVQLADIGVASRSLNHFAGVLASLIYIFGNEANGTIVSKHSYVVSRIFDVLLKSHWNCQLFMFDQFVDVVDFCRRLKIECDRAIADLAIATATRDQWYLKACLYLIKHSADSLQKSMLSQNGMYIGADYRFANGISFYYPWSYLGYHMAKSKYYELKFTVNSGPLAWFLVLSTILTSRPDHVVNMTPTDGKDTADEIQKQFGKILADLNLVFKTFEVKGKFGIASVDQLVDFFDNIDFSFLTLDLIIKWFNLQPALDPPTSRLDPPTSKGLDTYFQYFGRTSNIFPDLNIEDDFPPNDYEPDRIPE